MESALHKAYYEALNNQLAQVCNNLYDIIRRVKNGLNSAWLVNQVGLNETLSDLKAEYNTLFKLIYGNE